MSRPSAPAATAASATGVTRYHFPVPCDGSAMTGRCESLLRSGIALTSNVLRVYFSNVRMPRSQRITLGFPFARMYSAESSSSSTVADMPRFNNTGFGCSPHASRSEKFCMFRAPTWRQSALRATRSTSDGVSTSVTTGRPVAARASAKNSRPDGPRPRKWYGEVLGLYAPPRSRDAPARFTARAVSMVCSRDSTEHRPAMTASGWPLPFPNSPIHTIESAGCPPRGLIFNRRLASGRHLGPAGLARRERRELRVEVGCDGEPDPADVFGAKAVEPHEHLEELARALEDRVAVVALDRRRPADPACRHYALPASAM